MAWALTRLVSARQLTLRPKAIKTPLWDEKTSNPRNGSYNHLKYNNQRSPQASQIYKETSFCQFSPPEAISRIFEQGGWWQYNSFLEKRIYFSKLLEVLIRITRKVLPISMYFFIHKSVVYNDNNFGPQALCFGLDYRIVFYWIWHFSKRDTLQKIK